MHQHAKNIVSKGVPLQKAGKAMIMVHGRGATAESILSLAEYLNVEGFALLAPQADRHSWYPFSFMAPVQDNEPGISSGLKVLEGMLEDVKAEGIKAENIFVLGFSQGSCLASEFVARNGERLGGLFILSGGLIGQELNTANYKGDLRGMPVLLGCSDTDPHIPLSRVKETVKIFRGLGAEVTEKIYPNGPHTVYEDEINEINRLLAR